MRRRPLATLLAAGSLAVLAGGIVRVAAHDAGSKNAGSKSSAPKDAAHTAGAPGSTGTGSGSPEAPAATALPSTSSAPASTASAVSSWERNDLKPVSQPAAVGNDVALYVASGGQLNVIVLDGATGKSLWSDAASTSGNAPGEAPSLTVVGDEVIFLRSAGGQAAKVVAARASTGKVVWSSATGFFSTFPVLCPGSDDVLCVSGVLQSGVRPGTLLRFSVKDGASLPGALLSVDQGARTVGNGLYDTGERDPDTILASDGPTVRWKENLSKIFPKPGASTDYGWNFDRITKAGLFIGSVGYSSASKRTGSHYTYDTSVAETAGFRIKDGSVVWRDAGTQYVCSYLPCVGATQHAFDAPIGGPAPEATVALRVRSVGTVSGTIGSSAQGTLSANARATLEGFDPATGKKLWSFDGGHDRGLLELDALPPQTGLNTIVLKNAAGQPVQVNLADGTTTPADSSTVAWCRKTITYHQNVGYPLQDGKDTHDYTGQASEFACDLSGKHVRSPGTVPAFIGDIGASVAGRAVWAQANAVFGAPVS